LAGSIVQHGGALMSYRIEGSDANLTERHPWTGKPWAAAADAANQGLTGQGYIVHATMLAARAATRLTVAIIVLMLLQILIAVWPLLRSAP
jgi:hypothetical protein